MISKDILLKSDGRTAIPRDGLAIIHGTALRDQDLVGMRKSNVGLIWSPRRMRSRRCVGSRGGQPLYGDKALLERLLPGETVDEMTMCAATKGVYLGQSDAVALNEHWDDIKSTLTAAMTKAGTSLSDIECD